MNSFVKGSLAAVAAGLMMTGCATTGQVEELEARIANLEGSVGRIESTADQAMQREMRDQEARRLAQRALTEAQQANERIQRMSEARSPK